MFVQFNAKKERKGNTLMYKAEREESLHLLLNLKRHEQSSLRQHCPDYSHK